MKALGRIDLVIRKRDLIYAIELDNMSARKKIIEKVFSFGQGFCNPKEFKRKMEYK
jgi:hypothetical protein